MKNKKVLYILLAVILLALLGYFVFNKTKLSDDKSTSTGKEGGVITSIKDALSKSVSLTCEYKDEKGQTTKTYIKNGAVRITAEGSSQGEIIIKEDKMYIWDTNTKQGFMYKVEKPDDSVSTNQDYGSQNGVTSESILESVNQYKDSCKAGTLADSYFTVPTDVNFQDMTKILEDFKKAAPQGY